MRWNVNNGKYTLGDLVRLYKAKKLIINKNYQRGFVWSKRFQQDLIISILKGYPINSIILTPKMNNYNLTNDSDKDILEIVDGQQRVKTIVNFIDESSNERLSFNSTYSNIIKEIINSKNLIKNFDDIDEITKINIKSQLSVSFQTIKGSEKEIKEFFNMVQQQEEVKAGEIISNMPFEIYDDLKEYFDDSSTFLKNIGFNNKRGNFLKILISNFGIKNYIFHLGSTDDEIIKFSKDLNLSFKKNEKFKNISFQDFKKDIKHSFIFLNRIENKQNVGKGKLRFLKMFLLITNSLKENTYIDLKFLSLLNNKLSDINNKETLINEKKLKNFKNDLLELKIINDFSEFNNFIKLSDLFSKTKKMNSEHMQTLDFWKQKIIKVSK